MKAVPEWRGVDARLFHAEIEPLNRPAVLRGLVDHWPAVKCSRESPRALAGYLYRHCNDKPVPTFMAEPKVQGRFFYSDDLMGLNFSQQRVPLAKILRNQHSHTLPDQLRPGIAEEPFRFGIDQFDRPLAIHDDHGVGR